MAINKSVSKIAKFFLKQNFSCFLVGGCVRDFLMGNVPNDYDMCTNALPEEIVNVLKLNGIPYHAEGIAYGTVVALVDEEEYEITTYRKEQGYSDGRHPDSVTFSNVIEDDLCRRDFTINAMAYDIFSGEFIDPFGGKKDINDKILRCVGSADERIKEDGLRILRAIRFSIKYGMEMDDELKAAIHKNVGMIDYLSKERITKELKKTLTCGKNIAPVFLEFSDVISKIIPELKPCMGFDQKSKYHKHNVYEHILAVVDGCKTDKFEIKLAALLHDIGKPSVCFLGEDGYNHFYGHAERSVEISEKIFTKDLVLTNKEKNLVLELVSQHDAQVAGTNASVKRFVNQHGFDFVDDWTVLRMADRNDHVFPDKQNCQFYTDIPEIIRIKNELMEKESCFSLKDLAVNGNDLIQSFGLNPSPIVGKILNQLLNDVIEETVENKKEILLERANEYVYDANKQEDEIEERDEF